MEYNLINVTFFNEYKSIRCFYKGTLSEELDKHILGVAKSLNMEWYGSGYNFESKEREHVFDIN